MLLKGVVTLLLILGVVSIGISQANERRIAEGNWGGDQINVKVEGNTATIEYSCAHGTISGPLALDGNGHFRLEGTHTRERGGPSRSDEGVNAKPAVYTGTVNGKAMTLTVKLKDTDDTIGTFKVVFGEEARLFRCM
jgi:hypothetical protein